MVRTLTVVYTSASGHTEFVVDTIIGVLATELPDLRIVKQRAESTEQADLEKADILLLACGTWNTLGTEGQLSPYMYDLLVVRAPKAKLAGRAAAAVGLGDERYFFTAKAAVHLSEYLKATQATVLLPTLKILNEPFDQTKKITTWGKEFARTIDALPASAES